MLNRCNNLFLLIVIVQFVPFSLASSNQKTENEKHSRFLSWLKGPLSRSQIDKLENAERIPVKNKQLLSSIPNETPEHIKIQSQEETMNEIRCLLDGNCSLKYNSTGRFPVEDKDTLGISEKSKNGNQKPKHPKFHHILFPESFELPGFCPKGIEISVMPPPERFMPKKKSDNEKKINEPLHVFYPDDRTELRNSSYPWSSIGLLVSSRGVCTGTLVGDDIVLTASHCVPWKDDGSLDRIRFIPAFVGKSAPFGFAEVETVYSFSRNGGKINAIQAAFDIACLRVNQPLGRKAGYAGTIQYQPEWSDRTDWFNVGYPQPEHGLSEGIVPLIQSSSNLSITQEFVVGGLSSYLLDTTFDLTRGHSGGPVFGWFDGEEFPRVIAVVSSENPPSPERPAGKNNLAGGPALTFMVGYVRSLIAQEEAEAQNQKYMTNEEDKK
ncbi:putative endopeptidase [Monocercomonoides exilis]|uniref:putative endopeptidase n=1 Tax=Monocercomonoides exilis TaxID=2049356 RepID=UPI00355AB12A|nr:putative endopeptidase [Monocercomonoides exilis]|eukprot:MONOS_5957.1-p1 / transcript=MONOS_5957.1 / gene=MONOS_5957 / organism=Monocercomonoides_exilis_PA203 / gene_product=endopeptidase / transcript_product=endopeptidase / location=Mono_scaffold00180:59667-61712(-) / protein_length=437 / sequence_SO=supercontig / SO=protein_coding / is_pseudo=false